MANLRIQKRRRRENKTDYKLRLGLIKSNNPRIVIRKTNKYFIAQIVKSSEAQDNVLLTITSKDLLKNGWPSKNQGSLKSIPAGYLTGILLAKKIKERKELVKEKLIIDLGMAKTLPGSRIFSVVKGIIDGGVNINADEKVFPSEARLSGEHISPEMAKTIKSIQTKLK